MTTRPLTYHETATPTGGGAGELDRAGLLTELRRASPSDVVRYLVGATARGDFRDAADLRAILGDEASEVVILVCAAFGCPYCTRGFVPCDGCEGRGRTEGLIACARCKTLGAIACDFCGGSGLAAFDFFPTPVWRAVAEVRARLASRRLETLLAAPPKRDGAASLCDVLARRYASVARCRAVLRSLPGAPHSLGSFASVDAGHTPDVSVVPILISAELDIAENLSALATAVRTAAPTPRDDDGRAYQAARADVLQEWAADLARSVRSSSN